jgi:hypothetical protein
MYRKKPEGDPQDHACDQVFLGNDVNLSTLAINLTGVGQ